MSVGAVLAFLEECLEGGSVSESSVSESSWKVVFLGVILIGTEGDVVVLVGVSFLVWVGVASSLGVASWRAEFFCVFVGFFCLEGAFVFSGVALGLVVLVGGLGCLRRVLWPSGVMAVVRRVGSSFCNG